VIERYLRLPEILQRTGLSSATIYRRIGSGQFPQQRDLGPGAVGWAESEVLDWLNNRPTRTRPGAPTRN
jgi:prophage regulatory protein